MSDPKNEQAMDFDDEAVEAPPETTDEQPEIEVEPENPRQVPDARQGGAPPWVRIPPGMKFPRGRKVIFMRFPSKWTDSPWKGEPLPSEDDAAIRIAGAGGLWRQCICWSLDVGDIKHSTGRAQSDPNRLADELTRQMVRVVDGARANWDGTAGEGSIEVFWNELGARCRNVLNRVWSQLHVLSREQQIAFFESCIEVRSPG